MSGTFILVVLQVVAMGNFNASSSPRHPVYGWQPIGVFASSAACVKASQQLVDDTAALVKATDERMSSGVRSFRCLPAN